MKNREGQKIELSSVTKVEDWDESYSVTMKDSWSLNFSKAEAGNFVPREGDWILVSYEGFNTIAGIIIEGHIIRNKTSQQVKDEHEQWVKNIRLRKLEAYVEHGDALKERVKNLHPVLQARMARFAAEHGVEFWIDSAPYEMAVLEGAQALLNKVQDLDLYDGGNTGYEAAVQWIEDWWALNTKEGGYDYAKQMELVPDFGDGHSGNTAGMAYRIALMILKEEGDNL